MIRIRTSILVDESLLKKADSHIEDGSFRNRSDFIEKCMKDKLEQMGV